MKIEKIVVEGIFKIGTIALKTLIKNSINSEGTGFDILKLMELLTLFLTSQPPKFMNIFFSLKQQYKN